MAEPKPITSLGDLTTNVGIAEDILAAMSKGVLAGVYTGLFSETIKRMAEASQEWEVAVAQLSDIFRIPRAKMSTRFSELVGAYPWQWWETYSMVRGGDKEMIAYLTRK